MHQEVNALKSNKTEHRRKGIGLNNRHDSNLGTRMVLGLSLENEEFTALCNINDVDVFMEIEQKLEICT